MTKNNTSLSNTKFWGLGYIPNSEQYFQIFFFSLFNYGMEKFSSSILNLPYPVFKTHLLKIIRPVSNPVYNIQNCIGLKLLTSLRLVLSQLNKHRFSDNFQNSINPLYTCSLEVKSTAHFFLHFNHYHNIRAKLLNSLKIIDTNLLKFSGKQLTKVLLYGYSRSKLDQNQIRNIVESNRFKSFLF